MAYTGGWEAWLYVILYTECLFCVEQLCEVWYSELKTAQNGMGLHEQFSLGVQVEIEHQWKVILHIVTRDWCDGVDKTLLFCSVQFTKQ